MDKSPQLILKTVLNGIKVMLCVWWDHRSIIHLHFIKYNEILQQLQRVLNNLVETGPTLVNRKKC